ncbi:amidophosphoribosyltransferase [Histophilus somni]|uniref:amidophosphoribosyltransferase n=1 Tax=Histophilus somni TaxID=731 RepID=UPI00094B6B6A|nr:amidophosphoribosyltransferase [Histophilus somni]
MCGIVGIVSHSPVNQSIYNALTVLQHRGQDAAGIITVDEENRFRLRKANGLVSDVFQQVHMLRLQGNAGVGHVRYPTAGSSSVSEAQPFYVNSPYGLTLVHNGNLTNSEELKQKLFTFARRHVNTNSDSEILLNILAHHLDQTTHPLSTQDIFEAVRATHKDIRGAYACVAMMIGYGIVAFRDPNGIRPLVLGKREDEVSGKTEYMFASESIALDIADSEDIALQIAHILNKPYRQGFVKNRYVGRTFIMPGQTQRVSAVRRKLNTISSEFKGKNVLLVDDSIVRGTTSKQIVDMARAAGANKIYFASAAPEIRYPNVYGIDMPTKNELIAYGRDVHEIAKLIGVDKLIFQDLDALTRAVQQENPAIKDFDCSVFTGVYVTGDITSAYLDQVADLRNDKAKKKREKDATNLEMHNEA